MTADGPAQAPGGLGDVYTRYFASGSYDRRYPRPNARVMAAIAPHLDLGAHLLDYGCGSGRYLLPLWARVGRAAGFDVCEAALGLLAARAVQGGTRPPPAVLGPEQGALHAHVAAHGRFDVVLCLFGVLAHIAPRAERIATLRRLRSVLAPGGVLVVTVPNRRRRFAREQRAPEARDGSITYLRETEDGPLCLPYQLYDPPRLSAELAEGGFAAGACFAESVLPESWLANAPRLARVDAAAAQLCPARLGYGIGTVAREK